MTLQDVKTFLLSGSGFVLLLMTVIQISPIQINPWTWIANSIGRAINKEMSEKIDAIDEKVNNLEKKTDRREANNKRSMILRFGDEVRHGIPHSKEHYDNVLTIIHEYETYCEENPEYRNNVAVATIKNIEKIYQKHLEQDDFL